MRTGTCQACGEAFEAPHAVGRVPVRCPPCAEARARAVNREKHYRWRERYPEKWKAVQDRSNAKRSADPDALRRKREAAARRMYGIEPAELEALERKQGGVCAICGGPPNGPGSRLHVDHDHESGRIRGLLCGRCNTMLGMCKDDSNVLRAAVRYLNRKGL